MYSTDLSPEERGNIRWRRGRMCLRWHHWGGCADGQRADTSSDSFLTTSLLHFCGSLRLLQLPSKITPTGNGEAAGAGGRGLLFVCLIWLWSSWLLAMMFFGTLFSDYAADIRQTGEYMATVCEPLSLQEEYQHVCVSVIIVGSIKAKDAAIPILK